MISTLLTSLSPVTKRSCLQVFLTLGMVETSTNTLPILTGFRSTKTNQLKEVPNLPFYFGSSIPDLDIL